MTSVTLALIYNHRFERNVEKLSERYADSFDRVLHLIPFSNESADVVSVSESSYRFGNYPAQALNRLEEVSTDYYMFAGDDLLISPAVSRQTLEQEFRLAGEGSGFIKDWNSLGATSMWWYHIHRGWRPLVDKNSGVEWHDLLPGPASATQLMERHGYEHRDLTWGNLFVPPPVLRSKRAAATGILWLARHYGRLKLAYPLAMGYSDVFVLHRSCLRPFAQYAAALSATGVFPEIAVPTALLMACEHVSTERNIRHSGRELWRAREVEELESQFGRDLAFLSRYMEESRTLWMHPVKLSRWS